MSTKAKPRRNKKSRSKPTRVKTDSRKSKSSEKRAIATVKNARKSARARGTTEMVVVGRPEKYKVYGGKGGRVRSIGSKATASGIAGRLGVNRKIFREVDRVIEHLGLRKKIG